MSNEHASHFAPERLAPDRVGKAGKRIGAHAGTLDEGGDDRLPRQWRVPEDAGVEYGRVDSVRANERVALAVRQASGDRQMVDGLGQALGIHGKGGPELGRETGDEVGVRRRGIAEQRGDVIMVRLGHSLHGSPLATPDAAPRGRGVGQMSIAVSANPGPADVAVNSASGLASGLS